MITCCLTSQPLYPRGRDPDTLWIGGWSGAACSGQTSSASTAFRTPLFAVCSMVTYTDYIILAPNDLYIYIYIYIFIYLIEELLSIGAVSNSKLFSRCPAFKYLPRDHYSLQSYIFYLLLGVNVKTLVLFDIMWPIPFTSFPVYSSLINVPFDAIHCVTHNLAK